MNRVILKQALYILPAVLAYVFLALEMNMIQDDAFISYRFVANYLNGHGLVFNIGELVEGYTNFGWVIYLSMWGVLSLDYVLISQITGMLLGVGIIVLTYLIAYEVLPENRTLFALIPTYLVGFNLSLAYWAPAGLETTAFAFFAALSLYFFLRRNWLLIWTMMLVVWIRPEGAFVVGLLIVVEAIVYRRIPRYSLLCAGIAFVASLPYVIFKLSYYGGILPNPFYAKTGFDMAQLQNGLEYSYRFLRHYGFLGAGLVISGLFFRRFTRSARAVWLFTVIYMIYILLVGGDVLKVHRFYMPIIGGIGITTMMALWGLTTRMKASKSLTLALVITLPLLVVTVYSPYQFVSRYNYLEKALVRKMTFIATQLRRTDQSDFSVALPTIGAFSYNLIGHRIIDLLGLTDSTIARYSEEPIPGMETTWKEQKHNSAYILSSEPDYISFSTGIKPSAPAERALFLYPDFIENYYMVGYFEPHVTGDGGTTHNVFKRRGRVSGTPEPKYRVEYVEQYKLGLDDYAGQRFADAIPHFQRSIEFSPPECHPLVLYRQAECFLRLQRHEISRPLMDSALAGDSMLYEAHRDLMLYSIADGNWQQAQRHAARIRELVPWYWPRVEKRLDVAIGPTWRKYLERPRR